MKSSLKFVKNLLRRITRGFIIRVILGPAVLVIAGSGWWVREREQRAYEVRERVRALARDPDWSEQVCSYGNELELFGVWREYEGFTFESLSWLRTNRDDALEEIRILVAEVLPDFRRDNIVPEGEWWNGRDTPSRTVFGTCLQLIGELNGVECLDLLLECEMEFRPMVELADAGTEWGKDGPVRGGGYVDVYSYTDLLSAILAILYQERWEPVLKSELHQIYQEGSDYYKDEAGPWPDSEIAYIYREGSSYMTSILEFRTVHLTRERRDQIIAWAEEFLVEVPPSKWRRAKGIQEDPGDSHQEGL